MGCTSSPADWACTCRGCHTHAQCAGVCHRGTWDLLCILLMSGMIPVNSSQPYHKPRHPQAAMTVFKRVCLYLLPGNFAGCCTCAWPWVSLCTCDDKLQMQLTGMQPAGGVDPEEVVALGAAVQVRDALRILPVVPHELKYKRLWSSVCLGGIMHFLWTGAACLCCNGRGIIHQL